ncbi:NUAK family SNF1-like kinase 1 [Carcharodon carcharias]|uniref:NUAK family SNF1-like kinase 1 n=1 Tax=Carcharodon carcharias TaxID=13397 RepID=UPI001B7EC83E|nr:NUAK family SNF1-like kinase 1 [Carcharodon carcharias]
MDPVPPCLSRGSALGAACSPSASGGRDHPPPLASRSTSQTPDMKRQAVKRHHHKHNLRHRYEFRETLGKGTYGKVKKAVDRSGRVVAIKSIRKDKIKDEQDLVHIRREIEIMSSLSHPHIINIYEVFENKDKIVIIMEYASKGDLYDFINEKQSLTEQEARRFFRQIVSAIHYCHKNGIVHRDLKLENILLDAFGNVKIADFGLSNLYHHDRFLQTFCGSPLYASPEIVNGRPYRGPEVDSWSLGVLLYTLVHGTMPFDGHDYRNLVKQITNGEYREPTKPSDACGLIRWLLMVNPDRRATIEDVANHWWVNWGYKTPACEMESVKDYEPPVTITLDWVQRSSRIVFESSSKVRCFFKQHSSPLERQRSLKKSKKENDISHSLQEGGASESQGKSLLKRPKGILKKRNNYEHRSHSAGNVNHSVPLEETLFTHKDSSTSATETNNQQPNAAAAPAPKKGILKKPAKRESGYYSSPEPSESADLLDCENSSVFEAVTFDMNHASGNGSKDTACRRKGILKHNGKFSSSSTDSSMGSPTLKSLGSFNELAFSDIRLSSNRSYPSSAVSEDSILSSESFDRLDLPEGRQERSQMRSCVSADDLLHLEGSESDCRPRLRKMKCFAELGDSNFSLMDLDNVTEVYKKAVAICNKLI